MIYSTGYLIASGVITLVGITLFIVFSARKKYRNPSAAQNYEKIRNKLTVREEPEEQASEELDDSYSGGGSFGIGGLIGGFIILFIGVSLIGPISTLVSKVAANISTQVSEVAANNIALNNSSTLATTALQLVPGFFALVILGIGIMTLMGALRRTGII